MKHSYIKNLEQLHQKTLNSYIRNLEQLHQKPSTVASETLISLYKYDY